MKAIDTNCLVRFLVQDDKKQAARVTKLFKATRAEGERLYVSRGVMLETVWVLSSSYRLPDDVLLETLESLLDLDVLDVEDREQVREAVQLAPKSRCNLPDLLIGLSARDAGCDTTLTFDKAAAKSELFELI